MFDLNIKELVNLLVCTNSKFTNMNNQIIKALQESIQLHQLHQFLYIQKMAQRLQQKENLINNIQKKQKNHHQQEHEYLHHNNNNKNKNSLPKFLSSKTHNPQNPHSQHNTQDSFTNYTTLLSNNNKSYQQEILFLKKQNSNLKLQVQNSLSQIIKIKTHYEQQNSQLKIQFNRKINQLLNQLRQILYEKENVQQRYKVLVQELSEQHHEEVKRISFLNQDSFRKYQQQIQKLTCKLKQTHVTSQKSYFENSQAKLKLMQELDSVNYQLTKVINQKDQLNNHAKQLQQNLRSLQADLSKYKVQKEQIQMAYYKKQQQKNSIIIQLKQSNKSLIQSSNDLQRKIKQLDNCLRVKSKQLDKSLQQFKDTQNQLMQKNQKFSQMKFLLDQVKTQKCLKQQQLKYIIQTLQKDAQSMKSTVKILQKSNRSIQQKYRQTEDNFQISQGKLYEALSQKQYSEQESKRLQAQVRKFDQICQKYKKQNIQLIQQLQNLRLSQKSMKQKVQLQQNHIKTLEQIINQLKLKQKDNLHMAMMSHQTNQKKEALLSINQQKSKTQRQVIELSLRQQFSLKMQKVQESYQKQIQKILQQLSIAQNQRMLTQQRYKKQIQKLMRTYETILHQKDQNFKRRLNDLQSQLKSIQRFKR